MTCEVTPGDGDADGPLVSVSTTITPNCASDLNADGQVNITDLGALLGNFGATGAGHADGDTDCDGNVNISDLGRLLADFGSGC